MAHWTDDPKIHLLMTHFGKTGQTGKPTRSAFFAEQMNRLLVQVEGRLAEHRSASKEEEVLSAEHAKLDDFLKKRKRYEAELYESIKDARQDLLQNNPVADTLQLDAMGKEAVYEFEDAQEKGHDEIVELAKVVTHKRTAVRRIDDRIEHYHKQVFRLLRDWQKAVAKKSA